MVLRQSDPGEKTQPESPVYPEAGPIKRRHNHKKATQGIEVTAMQVFLDFEKPLCELEAKIGELRHLADDNTINIADEIAKLQTKSEKFLRQTYARLTPWQKIQVARHPNRPRFGDYVAALVDDFTPLSGDRLFAEDSAIIGGPGKFRDRPIIAIGQEKGKDTQSRMACNFGMARPEGYRKVMRLVDLANRFGLPILTFVDTPGAYPGIDAEERGQAEAIARSTEVFLNARVPIVTTIIGEGGSGGAVAIAASDCLIMLEHSVYSVISPEGCASILWRDGDKAQEAAAAMKTTAQDLLKLGIADVIVPEPLGGAHRNPQEAISTLGDAISKAFEPLYGLKPDVLLEQRHNKFLNIKS